MSLRFIRKICGSAFGILATGLLLLASTKVHADCEEALRKISDLEAPLVTPVHRLHNPVKEALADGKVVYGNVQKGHDIPTAKDLAAGGHFIWLRAGERPGQFTPSDMEPLVSATHGSKPALVIVELEAWNSPSIKPVLGLGVLALAAPGIRNEEEARTFLGSIKFPSAGFLGLGPDDTTAFLADPGAASKFGNQSRMAIAIIDSHEAAASEEALKGILGAHLIDKKGHREGFDAVLPDKRKLSPSEVARVETVARDLKIPLAGDLTDRNAALVAAHSGYRMFRYGSDLSHIRSAGRTYLASGEPDPKVEASARRPKNEIENPLFQAIQNNKLAVGFYSMGHDPLQAVQGTKSGTGKIFVWADGEHRPLDIRKLKALIEAVSAQTPAVVIARVPHQLGASAVAEARTINDYVKLGIRGLVQPNVSTSEEAQLFIDTVEEAARQNGKPITAVMKSVMIETREGLANLDKILDVVEKHKETMWVHVGPFDLLNSLKAVYGDQLSFDSPEFQAAIQTIETKTRARGIALGGLALSRKQAQEKHALGYRILTVGSDQEGINAGINQFLASSPSDPSRVQRERLVSTIQQAASVPWVSIPNGRLKKINDPQSRQTLNYVEVSGPITEEPFAHRHMQSQTTYIVGGKYRVVIGEPGSPEYKEYELGPGDAVTIPSGIKHEFERLSEKAILIDVLTPGRVGSMPIREVGSWVRPATARETLGRFFANYSIIPSAGFDVFKGAQSLLLAPDMVTELVSFGSSKTYRGPQGYFESLGDWSKVFRTGNDFGVAIPSAANSDGTYTAKMSGTIYVTRDGKETSIPPTDNKWTETFILDRDGRIKKLIVSMNVR